VRTVAADATDGGASLYGLHSDDGSERAGRRGEATHRSKS